MTNYFRRPVEGSLTITSLALFAMAAVLLLVGGGNAQAQSGGGAVSNLRLSSPNAGQLVIAWDAPSEGPTDYRVVWAPSGEAFPSYQSPNTSSRGNAYPSGTSYTVTGLPAGTRYQVSLRARYHSGEHASAPWSGPWAGPATVTISSPPEPTPEPTPVPTPEPTPEPTPSPTPTATAIPTPEPTPEPTPSPTPTATAVPTPEPTPEPSPEPTPESPVAEDGEVTGLTLTSDTAGSLTIAWNIPNPAPDSYRVNWAEESLDFLSYVSDNEANRGNDYPGGDSASYTLNGLTKGATFKVMMRGRYDSGGENDGSWSGPWTDSVSARVKDDPPAAPSGLIAGAISHDSVTLTWTDPKDDRITGYRVLRGVDADSLSVVAEDTGSRAASYTDGTVAAETTYYYGVEALSANGAGARSTVSATTLAAPKEPETQEQGGGGGQKATRAAPTGAPTITVPNVFRVPAVLTAGKGNLADADGLPASTVFSWQWVRVDGTKETDIAGATGATYTLTDVDAGKKVRVKATFADGAGNREGPVPSAAFPSSGSVTARATCNPPTYTGDLTQIWTGTVAVGRSTGTGGYFGFSDSTSNRYGELSDKEFRASRDFTIFGVAAGTSDFVFSTTSALPAATRQTLVLYVCDEARPLGVGRVSGTAVFLTKGSIDWSGHAERTLYLARDITPPSFESTSHSGTSLVITFNEELGAASSLANSAFSVDVGDVGSMLPVALSGSPSISGKTVTLTMSRAAGPATKVRVEYLPPTTGSNNRLVDKFGNSVLAFILSVPSRILTSPRLTAVGGDEKAILKWGHPLGGSANISYYQYRHASGSSVPSATAWQRTSSSSVTRVKITGLTNGTQYAFEVRAVRASGNSNTATATATPQVNNPATPADSINGGTRVPALLDLRVLASDPDELLLATHTLASRGASGIGIQWVRVDGGTETDISGETGWRYTLTSDDIGKRLKVRLNFEDDRGNDETVTSLAFPTSGTILDTASCPNPTYVGGAEKVWNSNAALSQWNPGFNHGVFFVEESGLGAVGRLNDPTVPVDTRNFMIKHFYQESFEDSRIILLGITDSTDFSMIDFHQLTLYVCDKALRLADATGPTLAEGVQSYTWDNSSGRVDLFEHGQRQLYISRDAVAPTLESATLVGTSLVIAFNEDLAAASSLANTAFTVKKTPRGGSETTVSLIGSPSISGRKVTLTLASALAATDTDVKVTYTKPSSGSDNKLADKFTNEVATFTDQAVSRNAGATGAPTITVPNVYRVPAVLTASRSGITDPGGLPPESEFTWQWIRVDGANETDIAGATGRTYKLTDADAGKRFKVKASFTDAQGVAEGPLTSAATAAITARAACNAPTYSGDLTQIWTGKMAVGSSGANPRIKGYNVGDSDISPYGALSSPEFTLGGTGYTITSVFAFRRNGVLTIYISPLLPAAERNTFVLYVCDQARAFKDIEATFLPISYTWDPDTMDWSGHAERTLYLARDASPPTVMWARLTGTSLVINFNEDLGPASSLANTAFTVKKTPSGGSEQTTSLSSTAPSISGSQVTLTLSSAPDASDTDIKVSYARPTTGTKNELADKLRNFVANFQDQTVGRANVSATGAPAITVPNAYRVPAVLTAGKGELADENGLPAESEFTWQWVRVDGSTETDIPGATYTLTDADAGKKIKVKASFTDNHGYAEGPLASEAAPSSGSVLARASCDAPTYTGDLTQIWTGKVTVQKISSDVGFSTHSGSSLGAISSNKFTAGTTEYTISSAYAFGSGSFIWRTTTSISEAERKRLTLYVCDAALPFRSAVPFFGAIRWNSITSVANWAAWSDQTERTLYLARDAVAPTFDSAEIDGTSLIIDFSEDLVAASSLANSAFTVKKTLADSTEETVTLTGSPSISGNQVTLTMSAALDADDTALKVSYTKPTSGSNNKLADKFGNEVASFTAQDVSLVSYPDVTVKFASNTYTVPEDGSVMVTINMSADHERPGGLTIPLTITGLGGAAFGQDYHTPQEVFFRYGQTSRSFSVEALHDLIDDDDEKVRLAFGRLPRNVTAAAPDSTTVSITDDEGPMDPAYGLGGADEDTPGAGTLGVFWDDTYSNTLDSCSGNKNFEVIWTNPAGKGDADEWELYYRESGGLTLSSHRFGGKPGLPAMTGTARMRNGGVLHINIRGRWGTTWGTWSKTAGLFCR